MTQGDHHHVLAALAAGFSASAAAFTPSLPARIHHRKFFIGSAFSSVVVYAFARNKRGNGLERLQQV